MVVTEGKTAEAEQVVEEVVGNSGGGGFFLDFGDSSGLPLQSSIPEVQKTKEPEPEPEKKDSIVKKKKVFADGVKPAYKSEENI